MARAQQRHQQTAGAAAEIEDRSAALVRERAVEADVVAPPPVLPVVQHGIFERIRAGIAGLMYAHERRDSAAVGRHRFGHRAGHDPRPGRRCHALSFRYGQRHAVELAAAARVAAALGAASHDIIDLDLRAIGGSALTADIAVPKGRDEAEIGSGIPVTYVPARNTIFLAYAIALAEVRRASEIVVGVNVLDSSGYPDCRPEWLAAMQEVARLGTKAGVERRPVTIRAPLIKMSKAEIIRAGRQAGHRLRADALVLRPRAVGRRVRRVRRVPAPPPRLRGRGVGSDDTRPALILGRTSHVRRAQTSGRPCELLRRSARSGVALATVSSD